MVRVMDIPHRFVIKQDLSEEYRAKAKARTKKAKIKMKRPRTMMIDDDDDNGTLRTKRSSTVELNSKNTKRSRSVSPVPQKKHQLQKKDVARMDSLIKVKNDSQTTKTKETPTSEFMVMYNSIMETEILSKYLSYAPPAEFITSHEQKQARKHELVVLMAFQSDLKKVLSKSYHLEELEEKVDKLQSISESIEKRISDIRDMIEESSSTNTRLRFHD